MRGCISTGEIVTKNSWHWGLLIYSSLSKTKFAQISKEDQWFTVLVIYPDLSTEKKELTTNFFLESEGSILQLILMAVIFDQTRPDSISSVTRAVVENDFDSLVNYISKGHSMRICDNKGWTPLHHAINAGTSHRRMVEFLLNIGKF